MTVCFTVPNGVHKDWIWSRCWTLPSILRWKSVSWHKSGRETCVHKFAASGCWKWCELSVCLLLLITYSGKQLLAIAMVSAWYSEMTHFVILHVIYSSFLPMLLFMCIILILLFILSFHWHVQSVMIPCCSQELLPILSVMYFFLPPFSTYYSSILSDLILPSIPWSTSQSCCS